MLKIVMTIVAIVSGRIASRTVVEVPQHQWIEGMAPDLLTCTTFANMAADAYIGRKLGAPNAEIESGAGNYIYNARKSGKPVMDIGYYSCNVPERSSVDVKSIGHLKLPHVINGANASMG